AGITNNISGYLDASGNHQPNTAGAISTIKNQFGAVLDNGNGSGAGLILNGAFTAAKTFVPGNGGLAFFNSDGALLLNTAVINNQNGSHLDNFGDGSVLTNTSGGII